MSKEPSPPVRSVIPYSSGKRVSTVRKLNVELPGTALENALAERERHEHAAPSLLPPLDTPDNLTLDNLTTVDKSDDSPWSMTTVDNSTRVVKKSKVLVVSRTKGELRIPNMVFDGLLPMLDPVSAILYLRLYRLSHGYKAETCTVGLEKLAKSINQSVKTVQRTLEKLADFGLIEHLGSTFGGKNKGTTYRVNLPDTPDNSTTVDNLTRVDNLAGIKHEHDDDHENNPHQREVMRIYESETGNAWTKADGRTYQSIKHVPADQIRRAIRVVVGRASQPPRSLAFFQQEILRVEKPPVQTREGSRKQLKTIIQELRGTYAGGNVTMSEFVEKVKDKAARSGVAYGGGLLDEVMDEMFRR